MSKETGTQTLDKSCRPESWSLKSESTITYPWKQVTGSGPLCLDVGEKVKRHARLCWLLSSVFTKKESVHMGLQQHDELHLQGQGEILITNMRKSNLGLFVYLK